MELSLFLLGREKGEAGGVGSGDRPVEAFGLVMGGSQPYMSE